MRFRRTTWWNAGRWLALTALVGVLSTAASARAAAPCAMPRKPAGLHPVSVVRVVDGDTIVVHAADGRNQRVRLTQDQRLRVVRQPLVHSQMVSGRSSVGKMAVMAVPPLVVVTGPPGAGKATVVRRLA